MSERDSMGLRLLKKRSGVKNLLFSRITIILLLLLLNVAFLVALFLWFEDYIAHYYGATALIALVMVLHLQNRQIEPEVRASWLTIVLVSPVFGTLLYLFTTLEIGVRLLRKRVKLVLDTSSGEIPQSSQVHVALQQKNLGAAAMCRFVQKTSDGILFDNTDVVYLPTGEAMLERLLVELDKAEHYIYLEYFSVCEGVMWGQILEVLVRKAKDGVDVRLLYDGICELMLLPKDYPKRLNTLGIQCKVFSPISPIVSTCYNYRDHRKIAVIDGHTAFNGGINLCDEYINAVSPYGHWKDTALMLKGDAAKSFERMFLQMWNVDEGTADVSLGRSPADTHINNGYVMPYGENPLDHVRIGQIVYMDILNRALEQVYIMTPYLILDNEMEHALRYAAARGVTVKLILPGIADKYIPYALAKTHYTTLLNAGVQIYEYTPGFTHGKMMVVDGREAVVGTINFDYRSFYHHFECGTYLYECSCIQEIIQDFENSLQVCTRVTSDTIKHEKWHRKLVGYLLKGFAPLL